MMSAPVSGSTQSNFKDEELDEALHDSRLLFYTCGILIFLMIGLLNTSLDHLEAVILLVPKTGPYFPFALVIAIRDTIPREEQWRNTRFSEH